MFQILIANKDVLLAPINYNEDILKTQVYDKVDTYDTLDYTEKSVKNEHCQNRGNMDTTKCILILKPLLDNKDKTSKRIPYLWRYETEDGLQREFVGIENCAPDTLENLPNKPKIMMIAHNSNYDCRFLLKHLSKAKLNNTYSKMWQ